CLIVDPKLRANRSASIDDSGGARRVVLLHGTACSSVPFNPGDHVPAAALSGRRAVATGRCEYTSAIGRWIENRRAAMLFLPCFHVLCGVFSAGRNRCCDVALTIWWSRSLPSHFTAQTPITAEHCPAVRQTSELVQSTSVAAMHASPAREHLPANAHWDEALHSVPFVAMHAPSFTWQLPLV